jgi:hypothetical protein
MRIAVTFTLVVALLLPASALAKNHTYAPPGNSAVNQYVENVPTAGGNKPANSLHPGAGVPGGRGGGGQGGGGGGGASISSSTQRSFARHGSAGRAAVALAQATAPGSVSTQPSGSAHSGASPNPAASTQGFSPLRSLLKTFTGSTTGGLGALLPVILVVSALGAMVLAILRRRRAA